MRASAAERLLAQVQEAELPIDPVWLAKAAGVAFRELPGGGGLCGAVLRPRRGGIVVGINADLPEVRRRFASAHALAHVVLEHSNRFYADRMEDFRIGLSASEEEQESVDEAEANGFAAELLLPEKHFRRDLSVVGRVGLADPDEQLPLLESLADRYGVGMGLVLFRYGGLRDLR